MAGLNKVVRRRQVALLIAIVLGAGAGGAGTWMVSEMNLKKNPPAKAAKGEPAPDMTGVVNQSFDGKVQRSAIAEAQSLNRETREQIKKLRSEMQMLSRDLKDSQSRTQALAEENKLLQTQLEAGKNFDSLSGEPLPGALAAKGRQPAPGDVPPPPTFWPADGGQPPAPPVMTLPERPGQMDTGEFSAPESGKPAFRYPWIHSGSFAEAIVVEGADAKALSH